ncbi:MAG TPA: class I SAM-dependent methyltransferase [Anaerolineales bacterium]|nr:class I SAM-dependent methyltransferase [Anaerolineales bacterium]
MDHTDHVNLLKPANLNQGGIWADFGAGSGAFTLALRELVGLDATIYAVDKDRARLNELEEVHRARFASSRNLIPLNKDFSRSLDLPALDGIVMANSLHFFKDKEKVLRHVCESLKPNGLLLLVEYNVDSGNLWVPYPLTFESYRALAPRAGFSEPRLLGKAPSHFLKEFYSALANKM